MADLRPKRIAEFIAPFRVEPGRKVRLPHGFDPAGSRQVNVKEAKAVLRQGVSMLAEYQMRLAAQDTHGVVMVLQAMDAAGKDGTIRHVMSGVNPQGVQVSSFKVPSSEDLDHDYLWRYAKKLPGARQHRDLQSLVLRGGPRRPRPPADPGRPEAPAEAQGPRHLAAPLPRDQRLGALPDRPGLPVRQDLPEPLEGGAARRFLARIDEPDRELEVQRERRQGAAVLGRLPEGVQRCPLEHEHAVGPVVRHPGRRQAVRAGRRRRHPGPHPDRDRSAASRRSRRRRSRRSRRPRSSSWRRHPRAPRPIRRGRRESGREGRRRRARKKGKKA